MPLRFGKAGKAQACNDLGNTRQDDGDEDGALQAYAEASSHRPDWAVPWYNAGLIHKYRGDWAASLEANARAVQCDPGNEGAVWNLGIAATALGDWATARRAWRLYGIPLAEGEGPVDHFAGLTPIRVHGDEASEVLWADRIDPARAILRNVPLPGSGHRYGDLVLHDGAPNGYRLHQGREVAVFDALALIAPSDYATFELWIEEASQDEIDTLIARFHAMGDGAENWSLGIRMLCAACSEGRPYGDGEGHEHPADQTVGPRGPWRLGLATRGEAAARALLDDWQREHPAAAPRDLRCVLAAAPRS
jgi:hypothetical protein